MTIGVLAIVVCGLLTGVELCVGVFLNPILARLPGTVGLLGRSDGARVLGRVLPVGYFAAVVLTALVGVAGFGGSGVWPVGVAVVFLIASVVLSVTMLVPINNRVAEWDHEDPPPDWAHQLRRWDHRHAVRLAMLLVALVSLIIGWGMGR